MKNQIKNFRTLLIILGMSALVSACQKETIEPNSTSQPVTTKFTVNLPLDNPNRPDTTGHVGDAQPGLNQK